MGISITAPPTVFLVVGIVAFIVGLFILIKNRSIAKFYQDKAARLTKLDLVRSKWFVRYVRFRSYVSGTILVVVGLFLILLSIIL